MQLDTPIIVALVALLGVAAGASITALTTRKVAERTFEHQRRLAEQQFEHQRALARDEARRGRRSEYLRPLLERWNRRLANYAEIESALEGGEASEVEPLIAQLYKNDPVTSDLSYLALDEVKVAQALEELSGVDEACHRYVVGWLTELRRYGGRPAPSEFTDNVTAPIRDAVRRLNQAADRYIDAL